MTSDSQQCTIPTRLQSINAVSQLRDDGRTTDILHDICQLIIQQTINACQSTQRSFHRAAIRRWNKHVYFQCKTRHKLNDSQTNTIAQRFCVAVAVVYVGILATNGVAKCRSVDGAHNVVPQQTVAGRNDELSHTVLQFAFSVLLEFLKVSTTIIGFKGWQSTRPQVNRSRNWYRPTLCSLTGGSSNQ